MSVTTTIRVRRETRDRLAAAARLTGQTADAVIDSALTQYERQLFWVAWEDTHANAAVAERNDDDRETRVLDRAADQDYWNSQRTDDLRGPKQ